MPAFHELTVSAIEPVAEDAVAVGFDVPESLRDDYAFAAGQHITLRAELSGVELRRNYSICVPAGTEGIRVAVRRLPGGAFSSYVHDDLRVGDRIDVLTPTGGFTVPPAPKHYAAIAAGSGITPIISLLSTILERSRESRCTLLYGNRTSSTAMFVDELAELKDRFTDRLQVVHVLSREAHEVELFHGRLDAARLDRIFDTLLPPDDVDEWLLCGPFELVESARKLLAERGVAPSQVHFELFHVESTPPARRERQPDEPAASASTVTAVLDGRRTTFAVDPDAEHILDALLRNRSDAPYACRGGVCGTCRARLVEGEVEMDQCYALEDDERAAGYVLTCQSRPRTPTVTVEYS